MSLPGSATPLGPTQTPAGLRTRFAVRVTLATVGVIALLAAGLWYLETLKAQKAQTRQAASRQHVLLRPKDEHSDWKLKEGSRVEEINRTVETLQREVKQLQEQLDHETKRESRAGAAPRAGRTRTAGSPTPPLPPLDQILPSPEPGATKPAPGTAPKAGASGGATPRPATPGTPRPIVAPPPEEIPETAPAPDRALKRAPALPANPFAELRGDTQAPGHTTDSGKLRVITPRGVTQRTAAGAEQVGWIPSGTVIPARLLSGIDASTTAGAGMPYPVLLRFTDAAFLPNDYRMDVAACTAVGAAVADLSSERVYVRTETLSCLRRNGGLLTIDGDFKGNVTGPDGRLGIKSTIIHKEGSLIARSLVAGFVSGISEVFKPRITMSPITLTSDSSDENSYQMPPVGDALAAAGMAGVGKSMELLAKHYLALAEKVAPVASVPSGVNVDVIVLKGIPLKWRTASRSDGGPAIIE